MIILNFNLRLKNLISLFLIISKDLTTPHLILIIVLKALVVRLNKLNVLLGYRNFSHLLIKIRLEENIVKEKESNNSFHCLIPY